MLTVNCGVCHQNLEYKSAHYEATISAANDEQRALSVWLEAHAGCRAAAISASAPAPITATAEPDGRA